MEYEKFAARRPAYRHALAAIREMSVFGFHDYIHHNPSFVGHMNIARFLAFYEAYKQTLGLAGHMAEIGVWKASGLLYLTKLTQIFEPESATLVHGFDWYRGTVHGQDESTDRVQFLMKESTTSEEENRLRTDAEAEEMYQTIRKLIELQNLGHIVHLHKLDVRNDMPEFFDKHPHLQFKLVVLDAGTYEVTSAGLHHFWPRLVPGGFLILDQYNHEISPGETRAVREFLPDLSVRTFPFTNHPSAYLVKPA